MAAPRTTSIAARSQREPLRRRGAPGGGTVGVGLVTSAPFSGSTGSPAGIRRPVPSHWKRCRRPPLASSVRRTQQPPSTSENESDAVPLSSSRPRSARGCPLASCRLTAAVPWRWSRVSPSVLTARHERTSPAGSRSESAPARANRSTPLLSIADDQQHAVRRRQAERRVGRERRCLGRQRDADQRDESAVADLRTSIGVVLRTWHQAYRTRRLMRG